MIGRVVSIKMQKTAVILVESKKVHPIYKKTYKWSKRYSVHDEMGAKLGDIVDVVKIRPISKTKHWQIAKILGTDVVALGEEVLKETAAEAIAEVLPEEVETKEESIVEEPKTKVKKTKKVTESEKEEI